jgi:hypothetical protein
VKRQLAGVHDRPRRHQGLRLAPIDTYPLCLLETPSAAEILSFPAAGG